MTRLGSQIIGLSHIAQALAIFFLFSLENSQERVGQESEAVRDLEHDAQKVSNSTLGGECWGRPRARGGRGG